MDCSLSGSSAHEIFQARILEWVAMPSFRESSQPKDWICVSYICIGRQVLSFFLYFTILYWFCHTSTWIRHGCTRVPHPEPPLPPPSPYHPSRSSQCTSPKPPVSFIKPGLAIHFLYKSNTKGLALFISASSIINRTELYIPATHIVFSFSSYFVSVNHNKN